MTAPKAWNTDRPTLKSLQDSLVGAQQNAESYRVRNIYLERELKDLLAQNQLLTREIQWHKQLSQNLSEAVCAYMRSRG